MFSGPHDSIKACCATIPGAMELPPAVRVWLSTHLCARSFVCRCTTGRLNLPRLKL